MAIYTIMIGLEHLLRDIMEHMTAEIWVIRERTEAGQEELKVTVTVCKPKNVEGHHVYQGRKMLARQEEKRISINTIQEKTTEVTSVLGMSFKK